MRSSFSYAFAMLLASSTLHTCTASDAYCPVSSLVSCKLQHMEKCHSKIWHGIDSLEVMEVARLNESAVTIKSLNGTFDDTVARVIIEPKDAKLRSSSNPLNCVLAPPAPTGEGNCTTHLEAYFSDAGKVLRSANMQSCGIITWINGASMYGAWAHADEPTPAPLSDICKFNDKTEIYHEVGTYGKDSEFFTINSVSDDVVSIKSLNGSFPDAKAKLKIVHGAQEKIAWTAKLFNGELYHGIMRSNGQGTPNCCKARQVGGSVQYTNCPVISWWSATGGRSCWETTVLPHDNEGECTE